MVQPLMSDPSRSFKLPQQNMAATLLGGRQLQQRRAEFDLDQSKVRNEALRFDQDYVQKERKAAVTRLKTIQSLLGSVRANDANSYKRALNNLQALFGQDVVGEIRKNFPGGLMTEDDIEQSKDMLRGLADQIGVPFKPGEGQKVLGPEAKLVGPEGKEIAVGIGRAPDKADWQTFYDTKGKAHTINLATESPEADWDENKPTGKAGEKAQYKTFFDEKNKPHTIDVTTQTPDPGWASTREPKKAPTEPVKAATLQQRLRIQIAKLFGFSEFSKLDEDTAEKVARASVLARGYMDAGDNLDVAAQRAFSETSEGYDLLDDLPRSETGVIFKADTRAETKAILEKLPPGTPVSIAFKALTDKGWSEEEAKALLREIHNAARTE